ncbi:MAG TPA: hydroxypyruvate reductase [Gammaproteobacteria bacterium]|nr:hydroxypyruvate reductase [Gammaproteobacteria bacterium]
MNQEPRRLLLEAFMAGIQSVNGRDCVRRWLQSNPLAGPVQVIAIGKAACAMASGAQDVLGPALNDAFVVTKHGYAEPLSWPVRETGHPLPDIASLEAGAALESFVTAMPLDATVLVLLSGGASTLLEQLPAGVTLTDLLRVNDWLLGSGLDIHAMNAVRKRLSRIKGGRLAQALFPRRVQALTISDVPGDDPRTIGSGPLSPDPRTVEVHDLPVFIRDLLALAVPLPTFDDDCFERVRVAVIASNAEARRAAAGACRQSGMTVVTDAGAITGDAAQAGDRLAHTLLHAEPGSAFVWGGETTVTLPAIPGRGGRCQTLALSAATHFAGHEGVWLLAAGTDGSDGPGDDAGAIVDGDSVARGCTEGLDAQTALTRADAGHFLEASGDLLQTGPTGTNVMDLVIGLRL